jgi:hypothetical protein
LQIVRPLIDLQNVFHVGDKRNGNYEFPPPRVMA